MTYCQQRSRLRKKPTVADSDEDNKKADSEEDSDDEKPPPKKASKPAPKPAPKSAKLNSDSDDDDDLPGFPTLNGKKEEEKEKPKKRKLGPKATTSGQEPAKKAKKAKKAPWDVDEDEEEKVEISSDDDDDFPGKANGKRTPSEEKDMDALFDQAKDISPPEKKKKALPKPPAAKFGFSDDEGGKAKGSKGPKGAKSP